MFTPARAAYLLTEFTFGWAYIVATLPAAFILKSARDMDDWTTAAHMPPTLNRSNR